MNQIPNIEETHNTREGIERIEFVATLTKHALGMQSKFLEKKNWIEYIINSTLRNAEHEHHHQLQKARETWLRDEIEFVKQVQATEPNSNGRYNACNEIIDRYQAELDQDKRGDRMITVTVPTKQ